MKSIDNRVRKLENRFCDEKPQLLWVAACLAGWGLALNQDRCIEIFGESGFLPTGRFGVVNLCQIPDGLNATDLERLLREHGAETRDFRVARSDANPLSGALPAWDDNAPHQAPMWSSMSCRSLITPASRHRPRVGPDR